MEAGKYKKTHHGLPDTEYRRCTMTSCAASVSSEEHRGQSVPLLVIVIGPTGAGKSDIAVSIAQSLIDEGLTTCAEIINADAIQLYQGMTHFARHKSPYNFLSSKQYACIISRFGHSQRPDHASRA
jgi:ABC-type cobalamin transport system ATPase subunit